MAESLFDCIIIGAGPAGLAAGLYASRDRARTLILEKFYPGGQIATTDRIENYPGISRISGPDLIEEMRKQTESFGAQIMGGKEVTGLEKLPDGNIRIACDKETFTARAVILAPGSSYRRLGVPGEDEFRNAGAGVSYCGTCDAPFFRGKKVVAVGGGNTAVEEALYLSKYAAEVTLVHRRAQFRATKVLIEELMTKVNEKDSNLKLCLDAELIAIEGKGKVQSARIRGVCNRKEHDHACDGVFIFVGMEPNTTFLKGFVDMTDQGFIKVECGYLRTKTPGVFAAGDCRIGAAMQLATAAADGVLAAMMMRQYFRSADWWNEPVSDALQPGGW
jgi:thioredoxin reductase (NADPH)